jgi:ATP-dependent Clp protease ATP-binding subunit ClpB
MFQSLTQEEVRRVVELQLRIIQKMLEKSNIILTVTKKAVDFIAMIGFDPQFGARPIKRVIQKNLLNELSRIILEEKIDKNSLIVVDEKKGALVFTNKK